MKVLILSGTPKNEGNTIDCINAFCEGVKETSCEFEIVSLAKINLKRCSVCNDGWGTCLKEGSCIIKDDDFEQIQEKMNKSDLIAYITPVYWSEVSEPMKIFMDRYRRCEAFKKDGPGIATKPVVIVAIAGGSGNGVVNTCRQLEQFNNNLKANVQDFIGVNRFNREYKLKAIKECAKTLCEGKRL